jgi:hypothetical protein
MKPDRNFENPKKPRGKKTVHVNHQIQTINQQLSKPNLQAPKDNEDRPIPTVVNGVTWENNHHYIGNNTGNMEKSKNHRVLLLRDSYARGCTDVKKKNLNKEFGVIRIVEPGAKSSDIKYQYTYITT